MFLQIGENEYVNLALVARVEKEISGDQASVYFYSSTKEMIAQIDWGSEFTEEVLRGLQKYGLVTKSTLTDIPAISL